MYKKGDYLSPTLDVVFKMMFGDENNKDMLKSLVETYLEIEIDNFQFANIEIPPEEKEGKLVRLDLRIITNEQQEIDVEVQVYRDNWYIDRSISYWASMYNSSFKSGEDYNAKTALSLNILGFTQFKDRLYQ